MAYRWILEGRVMASAWSTPVGDELRAIVAEAHAASARLGRRLLYLSLVGPLAIPSESVREELAHYYSSVLACADSMHIVIDGSVMQQSIKRSFIASVALVVPTHGRVFVGSTIEALIAASPAETRAELTRAAQAAEREKLFELARTSSIPAPPPSSRRPSRPPTKD
jgi:hypothetical protein